MQLFPLSLSIGILAGIWTFVSVAFGLLTWPTFVGWAIFFFLGANKEALAKALPPVIVGLVLGYLTVVANTALSSNAALSGNTLVLPILVAILAFLMTFMMNIPLLSAAPSAFAAAATFFGVGDPIKAGIPLIIGLCLGLISVWIPELFAKSSPKNAK